MKILQNKITRTSTKFSTNFDGQFQHDGGIKCVTENENFIKQNNWDLNEFFHQF